PSILFWSSIIGKDPIQLLGIAIYAYGFACWATGSTTRGVVYIGTGVLLASYIRLWSAPILMFPLLVYALVSTRSIFRRFVMLTVAAVALAIGSGTLAAHYEMDALQDVFVMAERFSAGWEGGSSQEVNVEFTGLG